MGVAPAVGLGDGAREAGAIFKVHNLKFKVMC